MKNEMRTLALCGILFLGVAFLSPAAAQSAKPESTKVGRERLLMDFGWRFAFGHATDPSKDFDPANGAFTYLAKAGTGAGAASADFDDRGWRTLNLPHDWAVEAPFDSRGSASHGYKAIGRNFPERSVGWYRKSFSVPESDLGRHITIEFDGVFRDAMVWVNGFYLGRESSGYTGVSYDISDYLNYGGDNVVAVRVDASIEEGWFYEGAGIYRHVWLNKTAPLHVGHWGTFVTTDVKENAAEVTAAVTVDNDAPASASFEIQQMILDADGKSIASGELKQLSLSAGAKGEFTTTLNVPNPILWSMETPYLHKLITEVRKDGAVVDRYETPFGIRTLRWDANEGFFLNGKRVELKGTCDHQDHAGVGVAVPDELNVFRVEALKKMGSNAIRTSHNPPAPELLDVCDRMGVLVMDENRRTGTSPEVLGELESLMRRDRNHPCVVIWSIGNEEWSIEGNDKGTRITQTMQTFAKQLDPTRRFTVAISGGWGQGTSRSVDVMGFNYYTHGDNDKFHAQFPDKPSVATEDASTFSTRGVYVQDNDHQQLTAYDENKPSWGVLAEESWTHYAARPYVGGLFQWTGFDYRGEETPFFWPAISSQFGILDVCGFPKDNFYYYQAWWSGRPVLHLLPHWNWAGKEGKEIDVWAQSNCDEIELFLNGQSQGRKTMKKNSHLAWKVKYAPGTLLARGYQDGKEIITEKVETTDGPAAIQLTPHQVAIKANDQDVAVITVQANDAQKRMVPTASNEMTFAISGPGKIIGVGNGDPSSHEPDQFIERVTSLPITRWRIKANDTNEADLASDLDDSTWPEAFGRNGGGRRRGNNNGSTQMAVYRGNFEAPRDLKNVTVTLAWRSLGSEESIYVNGKLVTQKAASAGGSRDFVMGADLLHPGKNVIAVMATPRDGGRANRDGNRPNPGSPGIIKISTPSESWKRSLFSGLAQIIVQSTGQPGEITLTASSPGLSDAVLKVQANPCEKLAALP